MSHGYYVITIDNNSSMIPLNWCQATYGSLCQTKPVSLSDYNKYTNIPTFTGYLCTCATGFTAPLAPVVTYSNNCTIQNCDDINRGALTLECVNLAGVSRCSVRGVQSWSDDLVYTLTSNTCPTIIRINDYAVYGVPLTISTSVRCYVYFTVSQIISSITVTTIDRSTALQTGPLLHCVCDNPSTDPLCQMNLVLVPGICPDMSALTYNSIPTQSARSSPSSSSYCECTILSSSFVFLLLFVFLFIIYKHLFIHL